MPEMHSPPPSALLAWFEGDQWGETQFGPDSLPATPGSPARACLYSIGKTFLATRVLQLVEAGQMALDQPLPLQPNPLAALAEGEKITVRQLLNHSAGVPNYALLPAYRQAIQTNPEMPWQVADYLQATLSRGPDFAPGQGWNYSNTAYLLLKLATEAVTGQSFANQIQSTICQPLGLTHTEVLENPAGEKVIPGWTREFNQEKNQPNQDMRQRYHPGWVAPGLLISTPLETLRFFRALLLGGLLQPQSLTAMKTLLPVPDIHPPHRQPGYGLGLMGDVQGEFGPWYGHGGGGPGFNTFVGIWPDFQPTRGRALFLNHGDCDALNVCWQMLRQERNHV